MLTNGTELTGKITKFGKYVYLVKNDEEKMLTINTDQISYIEEDLFDKNVNQETKSDTQPSLAQTTPSQ